MISETINQLLDEQLKVWESLEFAFSSGELKLERLRKIQVEQTLEGQRFVFPLRDGGRLHASGKECCVVSIEGELLIVPRVGPLLKIGPNQRKFLEVGISMIVRNAERDEDEEKNIESFRLEQLLLKGSE